MYLLMDIGCIECGVSSKVVGVFADEAKANALAEELQESHFWRDGGQNNFQVFLLPEPETVDPEYLVPVGEPWVVSLERVPNA